MPTIDDTIYYAQLEQGALYLAARSHDDAERSVHLAMADKYHLLGQSAAEGKTA